ncbi:unnamed protein product [Closterium sp. Naga37s-1]|nr:unnamed protein product [Closterium sp. Naga37s-1]
MPFNSVSSVCDFRLSSFATATEISAGARSTSPTSTSLRRRPQHRQRHSRSSSSVAASFHTGQTPAGDWQGAATSTTKWRCRAAIPHQAAGSRNRGSAEDESDIDGLAEESAVLRITNHHVDMDLSADDTASGDSVRAVAWSDDSGLLVVEADDASEIKSNGRGVERAVNGSALGRESGEQKIVAKEEEGMGGEEELGVASELPIPILSSAEEPKRPYEFKILKEELKFSRYLNVFNRVVEHPPQPLPNGQTLPASMTRPASDEHPVGGDCLLAEEFGVTEERPNSSGHSGGWIGYGLELGQVQGEQGEQRAELWPQQVVEYDVVAATTKSCHFVCVLPFHSKTKTVTLLKEYAQGANALVYTVPCGGYTDNHTSLEDCARRELSEEARLCGGQLIKLVGDDHPGLLEVKWCKNRFTPFLVIDPQDDSDPLPRDLEVTFESTQKSPRGVRRGAPSANEGPAPTPLSLVSSPQFPTLQDDSDPLPRDLEEFIEVHRVPVGDLQGMALSGDMLLPSVVTCTMALQYLKDNGWL